MNDNKVCHHNFQTSDEMFPMTQNNNNVFTIIWTFQRHFCRYNELMFTYRYKNDSSKSGLPAQ